MNRAFTFAASLACVWKTICTSPKTARNCSRRKARVWKSRSAEGEPATSFILKPMSTAKEDVQWLLRKLPDDCSLEDSQYHWYLTEQIRNALADAAYRQTLTQEAVEHSSYHCLPG